MRHPNIFHRLVEKREVRRVIIHLEEGYFRNFQRVQVLECTLEYARVRMYVCMSQSIGLIAFELCWEKIGKQVKTSSRDIYGIGIFAAIPDFHFPLLDYFVKK